MYVRTYLLIWDFQCIGGDVWPILTDSCGYCLAIYCFHGDMLLCLIQNLLSDVPLLSPALVPLGDLSSKTCSLSYWNCLFLQRDDILLCMCHNWLPHFPVPALAEDVQYLTKLEVLTLSNNLLRSLPKGIAALRNLKVLDLENNRLESLIPDVSYLRNLTKLNIQSNNITYLPRGVGWVVRKDTYQCLCTSLCHSLSLSENTFIRTCPHTVGTERDGSLDIVCKLADVSVSCTGLL